MPPDCRIAALPHCRIAALPHCRRRRRPRRAGPGPARSAFVARRADHTVRRPACRARHIGRPKNSGAGVGQRAVPPAAGLLERRHCAGHPRSACIAAAALARRRRLAFARRRHGRNSAPGPRTWSCRRWSSCSAWQPWCPVAWQAVSDTVRPHDGIRSCDKGRGRIGEPNHGRRGGPHQRGSNTNSKAVSAAVCPRPSPNLLVAAQRRALPGSRRRSL